MMGFFFRPRLSSATSRSFFVVVVVVVVVVGGERAVRGRSCVGDRKHGSGNDGSISLPAASPPVPAAAGDEGQWAEVNGVVVLLLPTVVLLGLLLR